MEDFHRVEPTIIRSPARLLYAHEDQPFPDEIGDVIDTTTYDAQPGWFDLGATKGGATISVSDQHNAYEIKKDDNGDWGIDESIVRDVTITTNLAQVNLDTIGYIFSSPVEGTSGDETDVISSPYGAEAYGRFAYGVGGTHVAALEVGLEPNLSILNRLAILQQYDGDLIRAYLFRFVMMKVETDFVFNKTGDQQALKVTFNCMPDRTITNPDRTFFVIRQQ